MNIGILSSSPNHDSERIVEAAQKRGHTATFIPLSHCFFVLETNKISFFYDNKPFPNFDIIVPRSSTLYMNDKGSLFLRQLEIENFCIVNSQKSIFLSSDKLATLQILAEHNIPIPLTGFTFSKLTTSIIEKMNAPQHIVKTLSGSYGIGTMLTESPHGTKSVVEFFQTIGENPLIQEFIQDALGTSVRCFIIDNEVVGGCKYQSSNGGFKSNFSVGGTVCSVALTEEEISLSRKSIQILGLDVGAVDIIRSKSGLKVIEVNPFPGLLGIEQVTKIDIASKMLDFFEKKVTRT